MKTIKCVAPSAGRDLKEGLRWGTSLGMGVGRGTILVMAGLGFGV